MSFRDLVIEAIHMQRTGTPKEEIHRFLSKRSQAFGMMTEAGDENAFEIRRVDMGEKSSSVLMAILTAQNKETCET